VPTETVNKTTAGDRRQYLYDWGPSGPPSLKITETKLNHSSSNKQFTRTSVNTPGFRANRKGKSLPMNPFSYVGSTSTMPFGSWSRYRTDKRYPLVRVGFLSPGSLSWSIPDYWVADLDRSSVDAEATTKVRNKLKDQSVNLAQAFAERKMTANLIAEAATKLATAYSHLRKGNLAGAADALGVHAGSRALRTYRKRFEKSQHKAIANSWLELQYGWKPLLNDVYGSAELLAQKFYTESKGKAVASAKRSYTRVVTGVSESIPYEDTITTEVEVKYTLYYSTTTEALHTLSQVGISNPAVLAWELLPYSFVVDWFVPIGNYLSSIDATLGLSFLQGAKTVFERTTVVRKFTCKDRYDGLDYYTCDAVGIKRGFRVTRTSLRDFPTVMYPTFKNPLSMGHALNAIALISQTFKK